MYIPQFLYTPCVSLARLHEEPLPLAVQCYSKSHCILWSEVLRRKHLKPVPVCRFNNNSTLVAHNACTCMAHACTVMVHGQCKPIATRELHEDKLIEKCLFEIMIVTTHWS